MFFDDLLFFMYIFAGFAGVLAILMAALLIRYRHSGNKRLLVSIRDFMLCTVLIDFIYFYFTYNELINHAYTVTAPVRIIDMCAFIGQVYFWTVYMREKSMAKAERCERINKASLAAVIVCMLITVASYGFMMDDYYLTREGMNEYILIGMELVIAVVLTSINLWYLKLALSEVVQRKCRRYMIWVSVLLIVNGTWNAILVIGLMLGNLDSLIGNTIDPTPIFIFATNIVTILLIMNEDFTALFKAEEREESEESGADALTARLDYIAEVHLLTEREREIMELAYNKMTNPEIAEKLCISKYTVKNHMHNIFEKLDVSTRAELAALVRKDDRVS